MREGFWTRAPTGWALVFLLVVAWEASVRFGVLRADSWPALSAVAGVFADPARATELLGEMAGSLVRTLCGFALGAIAGLLVGALMGVSRTAFAMLEPATEVLRVIPMPALIPPAILFLGIGSGMKVAVVALAVFWPVMLNALHGVRGVDDALVETSRTYRTSRFRFVRSVLLPAAAPLVTAGLRIALAFALITTVVTEMIVGGEGIGLYIMTMQQAARMSEVYAGLILLSIVGYALNRLLQALEHRLIPWYSRGR